MRPVSLLRCSRCLGQSPPCQRGVVWRSQTGGIKGWQISTWVCSFEKAPTVNPSVTPPACQLPFTREPLGCSDEAPLVKGGVVWHSQTGGIPQAKPGNFLPITYSLFTKKLSLFHIGWYFEEVPTVNPSVTPPACQLPLAREPLGLPAGWKVRRTKKAPIPNGIEAFFGAASQI